VDDLFFGRFENQKAAEISSFVGKNPTFFLPKIPKSFKHQKTNFYGKISFARLGKHS
jgi:hypothetical protein